jgi:pimeloyl-ACP methyl ester carboxylesterase
MSGRFWRRTAAIAAVLLTLAAAALVHQLPSLAAGGLLYPLRITTIPPAPDACEEREFAGAGVTLRGWYCSRSKNPRGTIVYLHGIADNRGSSVGAIGRLIDRGFDVVAYDSRRHGASDGAVCTYGYFEKADLHSVIDTLPPGKVVLFGTSLGASVALQEAASDDRVTAIVAAEVFSDLRTIARERAPFFLPDVTIHGAFALAEQWGAFKIDDVSPVKAAASIKVPVLLIHGSADTATRPSHSEHVLAALGGPKRLILVEGAGHNQSLQDPKVWVEVEGWLDEVVPDDDR